MDDDKITWLMEATGVKLPLGAPGKGATEKTAIDPDLTVKWKHACAERAREDEARRQVLLTQALRVIDPLKKSLQAAMDVRIHDAKNIDLGVTKIARKTNKRKFLDKVSSDRADTNDIKAKTVVTNPNQKDAGKDLPDFEHDGMKATPNKDQVAVEATRAASIIMGLLTDLAAEKTSRPLMNREKTEVVDSPPVALFTDDQLIDELIDPLLRSGVMPDGFLPDKFSRNAQMLTATNDLYEKTLTDSNNHVGFNLASMSKAAVGVATGMASIALGAAGQDSTMVQAIVTGCGVLAGMAIDGANAVDDAIRYKLEGPTVSSLFTNSFPSLITSAVTAATGDTSLAAAISSAFSAAAFFTDGTAQVVMGVYNNDPKDKIFDNAVKAINQALGAALTTAVAGVNAGLAEAHSDKAGTTATDDALAIDAGKALALAGIDYSTKIANALRKGSLAGVQAAMLPLATDFAAMVPAITLHAEAAGGVDTAPQTANAAPTAMQGGAAGDMSAAKGVAAKAVDATIIAESAKAIKTAREERLEAFRKEFEARQAETVYKEMEKELADDAAAFERILDGLDKISQDNKKLDELIARMQRNDAIFKVAVAIGMGGADIAAQFVSYAAVGTESIKLVMNLTKTVSNVVQLVNKGVALHRARGVRSDYESSLRNVISNQTFQFFQNSLATALNGVKLAVSVAAAACPYAAPAVPAVSGFQAAVAIGFQGLQMKRMRDAWAATKEALAEPENRRLAHRARTMNPTLAKYTIAYGAMVARDPTAIVIANKLGLDDDCLKSKSANVEKVKKYLELKFPDDGTVKGYIEKEPSWQDKLPHPAVSLVAVSKAYAVLADAFANTTVNQGPGGKPIITKLPPSALLGLVSTAETQVRAARPTDADALQKAQRLCEELEKAFDAEADRVKPLGAEAKSVIDDFSKAASEKAFELFMDIAEMEKAKKAKEDTKKAPTGAAALENAA